MGWPSGHDLRVRHGLRQADLAERIGYEQSYISALEVGLKGPPTDEFLDRMSMAMSLSESEQEDLRIAAQASQRKLVIEPDAPPDVYWLLNDLRDEVHHLTPAQVRMIREVLALREAMHEPREPVRRLKRRRKEEAPM
ncbi:MAG: XRE family transcriptional regulator [Rubrivivax sp.]|nr:MAG: XRE family transcriptional regulator [Rubrivivax sp.]